MSPADLTQLLLDGLWLGLRLLLPFVLLAGVAAAVASALCRALGLVDATVSRVIKTLCVVGALVPGVVWIGQHSESFTRATWSAMAEVDGDAARRP